MKLKNPEYGRMYSVIKAGFEKSMGKVMAAVFAFIVLKMIVTWLLSLPLQALMDTEQVNSSVVISGTAVFFISELIVGVLTFGLICFITDLILKKQSRNSTLLEGFKKPRAWGFSFLHALIAFLAIALTAVIFIYKIRSLVITQFPVIEDDMDTLRLVIFQIALCCGFYTIVHLILSLPFTFTWNILRDKGDAKIFSSFAKSFLFFVPRFFHYIGFVIYICAKNVAFYLLLSFINFMIGAGIVSALVFFLSFMQFLVIMLKAYSAIPVYWYSLLSINGLIDSSVEVNEGAAL